MVWGDLWAQKKIATLNRFTFFMYKYIKKIKRFFTICTLYNLLYNY